ncbi:hypothetical protein GCM10023321_28980 [Pseudonocardia eucalypti]|uniref:Uncharacterized protein n=1 Tax=Pseudonocardia eucalypti TaxID=648755 RepID=A0ABP9Q563_9PSEU
MPNAVHETIMGSQQSLSVSNICSRTSPQYPTGLVMALFATSRKRSNISPACCNGRAATPGARRSPRPNFGREAAFVRPGPRGADVCIALIDGLQVVGCLPDRQVSEG